jgi:hypothetical protein
MLDPLLIHVAQAFELLFRHRFHVGLSPVVDHFERHTTVLDGRIGMVDLEQWDGHIYILSKIRDSC